MPALITSPLLPTATLRKRGMGRAAVDRAVRRGELWQVHRGWYAEPGTDAELIRAMRLGGRLGCVSALRLYGAWSPPDCGTHLIMPRSASGRRLERADADAPPVIHWSSRLGAQEWSDGISPLELAIAHCVSCQPLDMTVAVLDSLLHRRAINGSALTAIRDQLPTTSRPAFDLVDGRSEEGIESLARVRLRALGLAVEPQVVVARVGRVDLVIDGWLAVELDGRATHAQQASFVKDRKRAALLQQEGFTVLQFSYSQVVYDWPLVEKTVLAVLARR
jgi:very-short-patch-repair endonuclease